MEKQLLSLLMMVKNEEKSLREVLETVRPHANYRTILDTGSSDATPQIIRETLEGVPGRLVEEPFVGCTELGLPEIIDYAATRNRVLDLDDEAGAAEFQLFLSGDEYLRGGEVLREFLEKCKNEPESADRVDLFFVNVVINGVASAPQPRVSRTRSKWRYRKEVHEFMAHPDGDAAKKEFIPGVIIEHRVADPEARLDTIWERHIPVLRAMLERDPKDTHALTFLAQSYEVILPFLEDHEKLMTALEMMGLYIRRKVLPFAVPDEQLHIETQYLDVACRTAVYTPVEIYARAKALSEANPASAALALIQAETAMRARPLEETYTLFVRAAEIAKRAREAGLLRTGITSLEVEWRAHRYAAIAAKQLSEKHPDKTRAAEYKPLVQRHVKDGMAAGGSWDVFKSIVARPKDAPAASPQ